MCERTVILEEGVLRHSIKTYGSSSGPISLCSGQLSTVDYNDKRTEPEDPDCPHVGRAEEVTHGENVLGHRGRSRRMKMIGCGKEDYNDD